MKFVSSCIATLVFASVLHTEEKPTLVTETFFVSGIECGSCVYAVQQSITETKGVSQVTVLQLLDSYANVTFDPQQLSEHQVAQAVREAYALHGRPYLATLKVQVANYTQNAAKVDALFSTWKNWVELEPIDKAKGELLIHFHELKSDAKKAGPQGWSLAQFTEAMKSPAPKGLGLDFTVAKESE